MWFIKAFLAIVVVAGLLWIAVLNSGQQVNIYLRDPSIATMPNVELRELTRELTDLRNMPVRDLDPESFNIDTIDAIEGEVHEN
jgi:hypothetical protein